MKRTGVLHRELSATIAGLGHGDLLVIGDAGLPVPPGVRCIDLAVTHGVPRFAEVLKAVLAEMCVESAVIAAEAGEDVRGWVGAMPGLREVSHDDFKTMSRGAVAVVRTGEQTPYANVGLVSGVVF